MSQTYYRKTKYGTQYQYQVTYRDIDPGCPLFSATYWAYDAKHALDRFWDSSPDDDWKVISVKRRKIS